MLVVASFFAGRATQNFQLRDAKESNADLQKQLKFLQYYSKKMVKEAVEKREQQIWRQQADANESSIVQELEAAQVFVNYKDGKVHLINYCNARGTLDDELAKLSAFPTLHTLSLELSVVGDRGLSHVAKLSSLQELWLDSCKNIQDDDLFQLTRLPQLKKLRLPGTNISDAALVHIARLKELTSLCLHSTNVTDKGLRHLNDMPNLESLWISYTDVTDGGLRHLEQCRRLKWLAVEGSGVTEQGLAKLRETINDLKVPPSSFP